MEDFNPPLKIDRTAWNGYDCLGATRLLQRRKTVLLNSTQEKQPTGEAPWVEQTLRAADSLEADRTVLLTSTGLSPWELACWAAGDRGISQIVAVPHFGAVTPEALYAELLREFELDAGRTCAVLFPAEKSKPKSWWTRRDEFLIAAADQLVPISIRKDGKLDRLLENHPDCASLDRRFQIQRFPSRRKKRQFDFDVDRIRSEVDPFFRDWLIHWTRACEGPWPGETRAGYYRAVAASRKDYPRSAKRTLDRIERERRIRASRWRIRGGEAVVSMSGTAPSSATTLMRWRSRYARFTIEPYGLAIRKEAALCAGVRPVIYSAPAQADPSVPSWSVQSPGAKGDWTSEDEYRFPGDLDLNTLPEESWRPVDLVGFLLKEVESS